MLQSNQKIIRHKVGLLNLAEELWNVSKACQVMGLSRDTFYRYRDAVTEGGVEALLKRTHRGPNPKNRVDLETENTVVAYAVECPAHGQVWVSNALRKLGVFVSASGVRSIWLRHDLANFKARLKALEATVAEEGIFLTEAKVQALKKKKLDNEAWGEIETAHPGYLGSQDTFYLCQHPQGRRTGLGEAGVSPETPRARTGTSIRRQMMTYQALSRRRIKRDQGVRAQKALKNDDIRTTR